MEFSHLDASGNIQMVDIGRKPDEVRTATAAGKIALSRETIGKIQDNAIAKGNVLAAAKIAGIQAAKRTSETIPLCHNISLTHIGVDFEFGEDYVEAKGCAKCVGKTGAEMEALTAVSAALLTIYDMCKAVDKKMTLQEIRLVNKEKK